MESSFTAVWAHNFEQEIAAIERCLSRFPMVSFDTEFPGFLQNTPREGSEDLRYRDLKFNVDNLKIIQLGLTLFDDQGNVGGTWEFNFQGFDENTDPHSVASISLLKANGLDLDKFSKFGVDSENFAKGFIEVLKMHRGRLQWVSFHGLYDSAYLLKLVTRRLMPSSPNEFASTISKLFQRIYDVKFIERYCPGLFGGEIGVERTAKILGVERRGGAHQAGSDSLLTANVFVKMRSQYGLKPGMYGGFLYGLSRKIFDDSAASVRRRVVLMPVVPTRPAVMLVPCPSYQNPNNSNHGYGGGVRPVAMVYPHPLPPPPPPHVIMARPLSLCGGFPAALPPAHSQYHIHM